VAPWSIFWGPASWRAPRTALFLRSLKLYLLPIPNVANVSPPVVRRMGGSYTRSASGRDTAFSESVSPGRGGSVFFVTCQGVPPQSCWYLNSAVLVEGKNKRELVLSGLIIAVSLVPEIHLQRMVFAAGGQSGHQADCL
jgi:hypothetical protein